MHLWFLNFFTGGRLKLYRDCGYACSHGDSKHSIRVVVNNISQSIMIDNFSWLVHFVPCNQKPCFQFFSTSIHVWKIPSLPLKVKIILQLVHLFLAAYPLSPMHMCRNEMCAYERRYVLKSGNFVSCSFIVLYLINWVLVLVWLKTNLVDSGSSHMNWQWSLNRVQSEVGLVLPCICKWLQICDIINFQLSTLPLLFRWLVTNW